MGEALPLFLNGRSPSATSMSLPARPKRPLHSFRFSVRRKAFSQSMAQHYGGFPQPLQNSFVWLFAKIYAPFLCIWLTTQRMNFNFEISVSGQVAKKSANKTPDEIQIKNLTPPSTPRLFCPVMQLVFGWPLTVIDAFLHQNSDIHTKETWLYDTALSNEIYSLFVFFSSLKKTSPGPRLSCGIASGGAGVHAMRDLPLLWDADRRAGLRDLWRPGHVRGPAHHHPRRQRHHPLESPVEPALSHAEAATDLHFLSVLGHSQLGKKEEYNESYSMHRMSREGWTFEEDQHLHYVAPLSALVSPVLVGKTETSVLSQHQERLIRHKNRRIISDYGIKENGQCHVDRA